MATHIDGSMKSSPEGGTITFAAVPSIEEIDQRGTEERRKVRFVRRKYSSRRPPCLCGERSLPYMRLPYPQRGRGFPFGTAIGDKGSSPAPGAGAAPDDGSADRHSVLGRRAGPDKPRQHHQAFLDLSVFPHC